MQSTVDVNERHSAIGYYNMTNMVREQSATISEVEVDGYHKVTEFVGRKYNLLKFLPFNLKLSD